MGVDERTRATPCYVVTRGGQPRPEELAALAVALTPVAVARDGAPERRTGGWMLAALHEGVRGQRLASAPDVDGLRW